MTSIDSLFKKPILPSATYKRKFEAQDAQEAYKATKLSSTSSPNGTSQNNSASVEDVEDEADDDTEAGPELPPEDDGEDDEGRFFDSGVTADAAQALDYLDKQDGQGEAETYQEERIDSAWLRRLTVKFGKKVAKNAELRAKYEGAPQKFMASEAELDAEIKSWSLLSEHSDLYPEFAESGSAAALVGLLAHENTDVAIGAIEIISELLDEDVEAEQAQWDVLVDAMLDADLLDLLLSNLARLDESEESDRSGVYHSLAVLEALGSQPAIAEKIGEKRMLTYLCNRIKAPEKKCGQNKQYTAEVLQVLLQSSPLLRKRLALELDGVDLFLQILVLYRKRDPEKDSHEEEYAENVFDALTCVVDETDGKTKFVEAEGVELCLIMLKEGGMSKLRALRLLDHAVGGQGDAPRQVCEKIVEVAGLKAIFSLFMKKPDTASVEHLLGIFAALLRLLSGESAERIRLLGKFTEKGYEKVTKLVQLRQDYARKVALIDDTIARETAGLDLEESEERADEWLSRRLDGGLFCLQTIDVVLTWLVAEDGEAKTRVLEQIGAELLRMSLREQIEGLGDKASEEEEDTREMLTTLLDCL